MIFKANLKGVYIKYSNPNSLNQTGTVLGYLLEFIEKHPDIIVNEEVFEELLGEDGKLNPHRFDDVILVSLAHDFDNYFRRIKDSDLQELKDKCPELYDAFSEGLAKQKNTLKEYGYETNEDLGLLNEFVRTHPRIIKDEAAYEKLFGKNGCLNPQNFNKNTLSEIKEHFKELFQEHQLPTAEYNRYLDDFNNLYRKRSGNSGFFSGGI